MVIVIAVVIVIVIAVMKDYNLVVMIITIMMMNLDNFAMMVPVSVLVLVADVDGDAAFLRNHHRLVTCCGPGQRRSGQDRKRARDKGKFVHVVILHWVMSLPCADVSRLRGARRGKPGQRRLVPLHSKSMIAEVKVGSDMNTCSENPFRQRQTDHRASPDRRHRLPVLATVTSI
jgi:hypothetical protein